MLCDSFQRETTYLRLSVTDHCNLRCQYCMPLMVASNDGASKVLTFDEITRMVRILATLGVRRVRLTGGEPLVRKGLPGLIRGLKEIHGIREVLLTTNGVLLKPVARELKEAGLEKINIHLDTLSPEKFRQITRWGDLGKVLEGIAEARRVGLNPIKLNTVVVKGFNDVEAEALLKFAADEGLILRFIELMPIGPAREMPDSFIPLAEIRQRLASRYSLYVSGSRYGSGPAVYHKVKELNTSVGFISPVSEPFCNRCDRIRISSDGRFQDCLAYDGTFSFRELLCNPRVSDEEIAARVVGLISGKREGHCGFIQEEERRVPSMYGIGG